MDTVSGNEVLSIHLGPQSNYLGSHLWNLEYARALAPISDDFKSAYGTFEAARTTLPGSHILFRSSSLGSQSVLTPRAIFCDFNGALPAPPGTTRGPSLESVSYASDSHGRNADPYSSITSSSPWEGKWDSHDPSGIIAATNLQTSRTAAATLRDTIAYNTSWRANFHFPIHARSVCLTPALHTLRTSCDLFIHGHSLAETPGCNGIAAGSSGSGWSSTDPFSGGVIGSASHMGDDYSYFDNVCESLRWHAEDCDRMQAVRIFVDSGMFPWHPLLLLFLWYRYTNTIMHS